MYQKDERIQTKKIILGLNNKIGAQMDMHGPNNMNEVLDVSLKKERKLQSLDGATQNFRNNRNLLFKRKLKFRGKQNFKSQRINYLERRPPPNKKSRNS